MSRSWRTSPRRCFDLQHLGLLDLVLPSLAEQDHPWSRPRAPRPSSGPRIRFVFGIEDRPYFHWQLAILFESLVGQLAPGWDINVVVCNDHKDFSAELARLIKVYGVHAVTGDNHAFSHKIDFSEQAGGYVALNRVEALKAIAPYVEPQDVICLMDTDLFLYGDLRADLFPTGNALAANEILEDRLFLGRGSEQQGIDLQMVLGTLGCDSQLKRGGVTVFMTGATVRNDKVIKDCFRFAQIIYLLGKAGGLPESNLWMAEMACFAMALTANGIEYELLETPQFAVPAAAAGDRRRGLVLPLLLRHQRWPGRALPGSEWNKQLFPNANFLAENLESFRKGAQSDVERRFFDLSIAARRRLLESRRSVHSGRRFAMLERSRPEYLRTRSASDMQAEAPYLGLGFKKATLPPPSTSGWSHTSRQHRGAFGPRAPSTRSGRRPCGPSPPCCWRTASSTRELAEDLRPLHEEWAGMPLAVSACYGIRCYQRGTFLYNHVDRQPHFVSSTICVDSRARLSLAAVHRHPRRHGRPRSKRHRGSCVFYEGTRLAHGRPYPLDGEFYAGIFVHYYPADTASRRDPPARRRCDTSTTPTTSPAAPGFRTASCRSRSASSWRT